MKFVDKTMNKIITETKEEFPELSREQIKEAFYYTFRAVADYMKDIRLPRIYLPKFCYFRPMTGYLEKRLDYYKKIDPPEGTWDVEDREFLVEETKKAIERIKEERRKRKRK